MWFNQYPYINVNDLNLDFILKAIRDMKYEVENFVGVNAIKYANPIQWNITSQYEKNTVVIDPQTGTAYISVAAVPAGVSLDRTEYWTVVFDLQAFVTKSNQNIANHYEATATTTATMSTAAGGWVIWNGILYKALVNITAGDAYVINSNIAKITIEDVIKSIIDDINAEVLARQNADLTLQGNISAEETARQNADLTLQGNITAEATARQNADLTLQGNITAEATARQNADIALNNRINGLGRKAIYLGNSYAQGVGSTSGTRGIYALTKDLFVESELYADGGVGFVPYTGHTVTFVTLLNNAITNTSIPADEVTDIVILSAWGDTLALKEDFNGAISSISTAMSTINTNAHNAFPNLKNIYVSFVEIRAIREIPNTVDGTSYYNEPFQAHFVIQTLCARNNMMYLGWCSWEAFMAGASFASSDSYHPSDYGYTTISANVKNAIIGNYKSAPRCVKQSLPIHINSGSTIAVQMIVQPDYTMIQFGRINVAAGATPAQYANFDLINFNELSNEKIVPPVISGISFNATNICVMPTADFTDVLKYLVTYTSDNGVLKFQSTSFDTTRTLSAVANGYMLQNNFMIAHLL